ncbi:C6 transcription factor [Purpureocillium lavendulum]|uniref:C6 transcription factor n=1 Tax=Purpureocillium lavendulum TaxID=1247861 RepID=A0AB34FGM0_9HYPO|nr:C6 transcription factor [Purpureocillium lavendulum]
MADATSRQALATTFAFGMVVSAAVGTAALHGTSGPSSLFRDGTRLVLVIFLICSSLWAATAFIATLVDPTAASACQAAVAVASGFDQVARIMLEEFLFWSMKSDVRATFGVLFPQAVIVLRFILGGIFVGIQRPQFNPVCVGTTLLIVLGVAVLAADVFIILMLCIRASSVGIFRDVSERTEARDRSKALIVVTLSLAVWTASSVPMTLGMPSLDLVVRTVLAAAGVLFVIAFVAFFGTNLTSKTEANVPRRPQISRPEYIPSRPLTTADTRVQDFPAKDDVDRSRKRRSSSLPDIKGLPFKLFPASAAESLPPTPANNAAQRPLVPNGSISKLPGIRSRQSASKFVSKFSVDTVISPFEERQSEAYDTITEDPASGDGTKRRSSMVLPGESEASPTSPKSEGSIKGSSFPNFPASVDKSGLLKPETAATLSKSPAWLGPAGFVDSAILTDDEDGRETVTFMLDQSAVPQEQYGQASNQDERSRASWHRRVGDECPTFSDRKSMGQIRIVTPPPPLLLNQPMRPRRQPAADPVILESPQEALDQIQQQLRKLEDPDEESAANEQQRLSLLANLEQEMGLQESRWQQMRDDFKRVSVSTAISSPSTAGAASRLVSLDVSPMANVVAASSGPSSPFAGTMSPMAAEDHDLFSPDAAATAVAGQVHIIRPAVPPQALPAPRPSDEPLHNDTTLSVQRQVDSRSHGAGSPSSSVSADGTDDERAPDGIPKERYPGFVLCNPASPPVGIKMDTDKQGVAPTLAAPQSPQSQPELERPVTRRSPQASGVSGSPVGNSAPMITRNAASNRSTVSAPSPAVRQRPQQPASRPRTMRPPRRPKRISTLPDIVEDPQPLKGKRETLGLFQFPWGERSDVATIPLTFSMPPGAVAPTIRSGAAPMYPSLENQIRTLGSQKYPASFFEDYDDYDEDDDDVSLDSSDDDFDEATLWEIASLLKSDKVPSRGSLFPGQEEERFESASIVDDYLDGEAFIEDEEELDYEPTSASLARGPSSPTIPGGSTLWVDGRDSSSEARAHGLPQPEPTSWEGYVAATEGRRVASRKIDPSNTNGEVWSATLPTLKDTASSSSSRLWTHPRPAPSPRTTSSRVITPSEIEKGSHDRDSVPSNRPATANFLWSQPEPAIKEPRGLPQSDLHIWANYPVSENTLCRAKTPAANPKARETRELWNTKSAIISPSEASGLYASFASTGRDNTMWLPSPGAAKSSALDRNSINASTNTVSQPHLTSGSPMATSEETTETLEDCPSIAECAKASPDPRPRLWSPPQPIEPVLRGLARPDREVWESYLVPEQLERKIRSPEPLPSIKSSSLWAPRQEQGNCVASRGLLHSSVTDTTQSNAMNASVVAPTFPSTSVPRDIRDAASTGGTESSHLSAEFKTGLWRPTAVVTEEPQGLFQVGHSVAYDRNAKPAAQVTRPSRRTEQRPLAAVEATGLWTASPSRHSFTHDWVSLSSVRPNTPGGTSSYSGSESPRSDASSAYSSVTGMSTVNSVAAVCQPTNAEEATPSTNRPTEGRKELSLVPEFVSEVQWQADATAARKEVVDGFTQVPLLAEFVSETQWQADVAVARKKKVEEGFTQVPLLAEFVSETQWQATLKDANQAGEVDADTAEDALARAAHDPATPAVWAEALRDALGASSLIEGPARALGPPPSAQVQVQAQAPPPVVKASGFDVARHHPVFAVSVLDTSSGGDVHPAAWGYLNTSINGDPDSMVR